MIDSQTEPTQAQNGKVLPEYKMFKQVGDDLWQGLPCVRAAGTVAAKKLTIKNEHLEQEARAGELKLAAIGMRFWTPTSPKPKVTEETWDFE